VTLQLINNSDPNVFGRGVDITFDESGDIALVESSIELLQEINKAVISPSRNDGYGTKISILRGTKNQYVTQAMGVMTVISSLQYLKKLLTVNPKTADISNFSVANINIIQQDTVLKLKLDIVFNSNRIQANVAI